MALDLFTLMGKSIAARTKPETIGGKVSINVHFKAWATLARSPEEAGEIALKLAREEWPESDGWINHDYSIAVMETGFIRESLLEIDAFGFEVERNESDEMVM